MERSLWVCVISRGEPGDGGESERVVAEDLFMEKRREWLARGLLLTIGAVGAEATEGGAVSTMAEESLETWACEVDRRKMLDIVRLKLEVEPRVERRVSEVPVEMTSFSEAFGVVDSIP